MCSTKKTASVLYGADNKTKGCNHTMTKEKAIVIKAVDAAIDIEKIIDTLSDIGMSIEPNENYMENGFWYFGGTDGGNRYMYLLGEDVDTGKKMSMTFWSAWSEEGIKSYSLANAEHLANIIYLLVSENIPYSGTVGYIEAWASPKVQREAFDTAVKEIPTDTHTSRGTFNLNGQMVEKPQHGVYVINGRKVLVK